MSRVLKLTVYYRTDRYMHDLYREIQEILMAHKTKPKKISMHGTRLVRVRRYESTNGIGWGDIK